MGDGSYPVTFVAAILIAGATADCASYLFKESQKLWRTRSFYGATRLASITTAGYFGYQEIAEKLEEDADFSKVNSHIMAANCTLISIACTNYILSKLTHYGLQNFKRVADSVRQICSRENKVAPQQQQITSDIAYSLPTPSGIVAQRVNNSNTLPIQLSEQGGVALHQV